LYEGRLINPVGDRFLFKIPGNEKKYKWMYITFQPKFFVNDTEKVLIFKVGEVF
jgi:hypothetical protein